MRNVKSLLVALLLPGAVFAAPEWVKNFENGTLADWTKLQAVSADRMQIVENPVKEGSKALKVTVRQGDDPINSGNDRAELIYMTLEPKGSEYYYRWSVMFPEGYPSSPKWQLFTQWHQEGLAGTPPLELYVVGEEIRVRAGGHEGPVLWTGPLERGQWQDFILHIKWSDNPTEGFVELFKNGEVVLPRTAAATQLPGQLNYFKLGLYRSKDIAPEGVIYFDDVRMASALADVLPAAPPPATSQPTEPGTGTGSDNGNVIATPTVDPEGPAAGPGDLPTPEDLAQVGCTASGGSAFPLSAAVAFLGLVAVLRRRRLARVTVPISRSNRR